MTTKKTFLLVLLTAIITGIVTALAITTFNGKKEEVRVVTSPITESKPPIYATAAFSAEGEPVNFSEAAERTVHSVVHVKTVYEAKGRDRSSGDPFFDWFFGYRDYDRTPQPAMGSSSGVIISADGYIVTNNHVIDGASEINVTFNDKKTLTAKVIGADKNTDIALIKVDANDLPALTFGNSDNLRLGEWVLAVGNPFNLTSTVTAGIVSAKARDINIINSEFRIESFIQTDAVINPGNSGGALVNLRGELIGINTAIASRSGQYEGYGFAVPSSIVKKTVEDLMEFGTVQRALLGIRYQEINQEVAKEYGIKKLKGVYIAGVEDNSAAKEAGIQVGDILLNINGKEVTSSSVVQEEVGKSRPGDKMELTLNRDGKMKQITVILRTKAGKLDPALANADIITRLGATYKDVTPETRRKLGIYGGAQIDKLSDGKLKEKGIKEGFIITSVNQRTVRSVDGLKDLLKNVDESNGILIVGIYPNGQKGYTVIGLDD
ncbi:MAG: Do family serine endopeptidase [Prevotellaceae bacterium]|nr:Do family serine endopeptidase [Prevotellaceae bacterium]